jgi:hypothetical protein
MTGNRSSGPVAAEPIGIVFDPVELHPPAAVTRTPRTTAPLAFAVNVIERAVLLPTIPPPVIVHE